MHITANKQKRQKGYIWEGAFAYLQNVRCNYNQTQNMYDYISLQSDSNHTQSITIEELTKIFSKLEHCKISTKASCIYKLGEHNIQIQGIKCDRNGNYSFNDDSGFTEINLIEINIPQGAESLYENEIETIAKKLSTELKWEINWRD